MARMKNETIKNLLEGMIAHHDRMKKSYFWNPPGSASQRRNYEVQNSDEFNFKFRKSSYEVKQLVDCSARNIYYKLTVLVDGIPKDVRALKKVIKLIALTQKAV